MIMVCNIPFMRWLINSCLTTALLLAVAVSSLAQKDVTPTPDSKPIENRKARSRQKDENAVNVQVVYSATSKRKMISLGNKTSNYILIDWLKPTGDRVTLEKDLLEIKLKIISSHAIRNENVVVYHNQKRLGSRMDESGLLGDMQEFNYTNAISLTEGVNEIVVEVKSNGMTRRSDPLVVHRTGKVASVRAMGAASAAAERSTSVYWWTAYDPVSLKGKPYSSPEKMLPIRFKVLTSERVSLDSIVVHHNSGAKRPGPKAVLEKDYQGNYTFSDEVMLKEFGEPNEIYLEVFNPSGSFKSEKLLVDYSPMRPNLHILSIGTETNLQYTLKDARDFARLFSRQGGAAGNTIFNKILIDTLIGSLATAQEIKGTIEELKVRYFTGSISADDVILTFISSHGFLLDGDFRVQGDDYSPARQRSTSVSFRNDVVGILEAIPCKKIIMIDACHSGGARANPSDINFEINKLNSIGKGLTVFASSRGEEQSYEDPTWQNGAFTASIVKALAAGMGDADGNGIISLHELSAYVGREVAAMVLKVKKRQQNPVLVNDGLGDVAIYVLD